MKHHTRSWILPAALATATVLALPTPATPAETGINPAENLPPNTRRLTWFGERAEWSHGGAKILFLEKTFGDAYEVEVATGRIHPMTHHYAHNGYTRAQYLSNGDILLSGPEKLDPLDRGDARVQCVLWVLGRDLKAPAVSLGIKCSEGPAVSRTRLHIAWTQVSAQYPDRIPAGISQIHEADIVYDAGVPRLSNEKLVLDERDLPFSCTLESQSFRPPHERELTFSTYGYQGGEAFLIDLETKKVTNLTNTADLYEEPEGIFPDGVHTLVETDRQRPGGWRNIDMWKLRLDGSGAMERLTYFNDVDGFKASNGVVSDDGRWLAFQLARSADDAGVGYGIFVADLTGDARMPAR